MLFVLALGSARPAAADEAAPVSEPEALVQARAAFRRGTELARAARWDDARGEFERSHALRPHPITTYNIGFCDRAVGRPARALWMFQRALTEHETRTGGELPDHLIVLTHQYLDEVSRRVARVRVHLPPGAGLSIDGHPLESFSMRGVTLFVLGPSDPDPESTLGTTSPLVVLDPGAHVFVASLAGSPDRVVTRRLEPASETEVELRFDAAPRARPLPAQRSSAAPKPPAEAEPASTFDRRWAYATLGLGGAALVAGAVSGTVALRKRSELDGICGLNHDDCPRSRQGDIDTMETSADIATGAFVIGGAVVAAGVTLLVLAPPSREEKTSPVPSLSLRLGPTSATLAAELD